MRLIISLYRISLTGKDINMFIIMSRICNVGKKCQEFLKPDIKIGYQSRDPRFDSHAYNKITVRFSVNHVSLLSRR